MMVDTIIKIDEKTLEKIKEKIKDTEFKSVQDYVNYLLEQIVSEEPYTGETYSEDEEKALKEDLKDLGYI